MPDSGVVAATTEEVLAWAGSTGLTVHAGPPGDAELSVWLLALLPEQQLRPGHGGGAIRFRLRFLCCAGRADDLASLDRFLQATLGSPYPAVFEAVPADVWALADAVPRPAFLVDVPVRLDLPQRAAPMVTEELTLRTVPHRLLRGTVLGPGDVPLAGLRVERADGLAATETDHAGRFELPGATAGAALALRLTGRGRQFHHQVPADSPSPTVIRCEFRED
jgi:hypothetical protein